MKATLALVAAGAALLAGWVVLRVERARVARGNLLGAKKMVKTARPIFWHAFGRAAGAVLFAGAVVLVCVYLASTR